MRRFGGKREKDQYDLIVYDDPKAIGSEAFRTLRTNLQFTSPDRELKNILITSAGPDDGKSTVAGNLAAACAQAGSKTVLVGCDLRKPVLHKIFSIANMPGLTGFLTGVTALENVIKPSRRIKGLDLIPSGPIPPNPVELLQSQRMGGLCEELAERYDCIIYDAAPVIAVADAAVLANRMDGTVLVIGAHRTAKDMALQAKNLLEQANAKILGVVLNRVRWEDKDSQYYYYQYSEVESN